MQHKNKTTLEQCFTINGLRITGKLWHPSSEKEGVIALHGWLDNANSFDLLAPALSDRPFLALDLPGQGKSDFRSAHAPYNIWSEIDEILQVSHQLGWETFTLLGHSRGAAVAALLAGTFPARISRLILIEGGIPHPGEDAHAPEQLAKAITANRQIENNRSTVFSTRDLAIAARQNGFTKVNEQAATILAERVLIEDRDGFSWRADPRIKIPSDVRLNRAQIMAFLKAISAPTLLINAKKGLFVDKPEANDYFAAIEHLKRYDLEGGHHLHLEGAENEIAELVSAFCVAK